MSSVAPSASYSLTLRLAIKNRPGMLGRVAMAIGQAGGAAHETGAARRRPDARASR